MISGILLGAGESKRMGRNKLILPVGKTTLFERCLQTLMNSRLQELVVVLSPRNGELAEKLNNYPPGKKKKFKLVTNSRFKQGISTSIVTGIRSVDGESTGALICLGDQPFLKTSTVNALLRAFQRKKGLIVVPVYRGKRGNPVLFDRVFFRDLMKLKGDKGGKSIVDRNPDKTHRVRTRSGGILQDMDTWEVYRKFRDGQRGKGHRQGCTDRKTGERLNEI